MIQGHPSVDALVGTFLEKWEDRDVLELAAQTEELKGSGPWKLLTEILETGRELGHRRLEDSPPLEAGQYAKQMGYLAGTRLSIEVMEAVIAQAQAREAAAAAAEREDASDAGRNSST